MIKGHRKVVVGISHCKYHIYIYSILLQLGSKFYILNQK